MVGWCRWAGCETWIRNCRNFPGFLQHTIENETRNWSKHLITDGCAKRQLGSEIAEISLVFFNMQSKMKLEQT